MKIVIAWSDRRNLCSLVRDALREMVAESEMRALGDDATVIHANETTEAIRDRLRERLDAGDHLFVVEFETWSGYGSAVDTSWLLARGH
ncbi:MAG: hypothetical protein WD472_00900 [Dehalococcoidia bacterium]